MVYERLKGRAEACTLGKLGAVAVHAQIRHGVPRVRATARPAHVRAPGIAAAHEAVVQRGVGAVREQRVLLHFADAQAAAARAPCERLPRCRVARSEPPARVALFVGKVRQRLHEHAARQQHGVNGAPRLATQHARATAARKASRVQRRRKLAGVRARESRRLVRAPARGA